MSADKRAEKRLEERKSSVASCRLPGIMTLCLLAVCLAAVPFLTAVIKSPDFSENENRMLAKPPVFSFSSLVSGRFFSELEDCMSDRIVFRDAAVRAHADLSLAACLFLETNGVIPTRDGRLIARRHVTEERRSSLSRAVENGLRLSELIGTDKTLFSVVASPAEAEKESLNLLARAALNRDSDPELPYGIEYIEGFPAESFYGTDHHWTTGGAFSAYTRLAPLLGVEPYKTEDFHIETFCSDFRGTLVSRSGLYGFPADRVELFRYTEDRSFCVTDMQSGERLELTGGFYDMTARSRKDKYSVFLGGNYGYIRIEGEGKDRPRLLLLKDSYANSLIPFLARHFDIDAVDPRYFRGDIKDIAGTCDRALILYSIDQLATDAYLERLLIDQPSATSSSIMAAKPATIPMVAKYGSASRFC